MAELYTRWVQFGAFNPLSRIHHEGDNPVEPWLFGPEAEKNAKAAIELKYRLLPYIYTYAREAYDTGLPIMRLCFWNIQWIWKRFLRMPNSCSVVNYW